MLMCKSNTVFTPALLFHDALFKRKSSLNFLLQTKEKARTVITDQESNSYGTMKSSRKSIKKTFLGLPVERCCVNDTCAGIT